ncbi:hypothetical protein N2603_22305 [Bradyrhizobium huanghuaihaiense]|uniref:hypothetical protein n=1 Tax=Bradyrhizobium huanghuaihaiense TaxID=990078 RepID=UPI0021A9B82E|nr:hypothetical protein [Bradyrhizobium sp. CB3035]UWU81099.1 hypothetical protein N2603_22305 [Bradyrhizobium sp. CB3035]
MALAADHHDLFRLILAFQKIKDPDLRRMILQHVETLEQQRTTRGDHQSADDLRMPPKRFADDSATKSGVAQPEPDLAVNCAGLQMLAGPVSG